MKERGYIQLDESIYFKWLVFIRLISEIYDYVTITDHIYEKDKNNVIIITPSDLSYVISKIRVDEVPNINFTFNTVYNEKGVVLIVDKELLALISLYNLFKYE